MLSREQIDFYNENGYLMVENAVTPEQLKALQETTYRLIDASRPVTETNDVYDLDDGHSPDNPRLTRIKLPHKQDPLYWDVLKNSAITEVLTDLLGPDTLIQTSKLNTKAPGGGQAVEWHQDWAFYPHTNDSMLAFGLMLEDVNESNGPLKVIPGSHRGPVLAHTNADGVFCGAVDPSDPDFHLDQAVTLTGKAGSMTVHHARTLHGSAPNTSDRNRLILFYECHAADAWPILGAGSYIHSLGQRAFYADLQDRIVTGKLTMTPRMEALPIRLPLPPAPQSGSIFKTQKSGGARSAFAA
ncbi:phytanoyl-CoA dioxygenase family protein [Thalassobaculum sp.]|jgi:ectoine hydroxylase-related dioxygenase (phytanoyl-CoA dioxygenase family)|uniref:phytanoyl-CoA dioxygenase family protein n=1 Tax=Thalassobaculum sp. TaxID=2022740 RepID=UPI003B5B45D7